jgi:hypothetical protein
MDEEYPAHRKALEDGDWLKDGKVIHYWFRNNNYPVSFYVVVFIDYNKIPTIRCIRVFGGDYGLSIQISVDKSIEMENWKQIFEENKQ